MDRFSRRRFLSSGTAAAALRGASFATAEDILLHPRQSLETLERSRILAAANRYLGERPRTISSIPAPRSAGGPHDYYSEADYFWPDPKNPRGPYVNRDGESNPDNFNTHRELLIRLGIEVGTLTAAWRMTGRRGFADHAAAHLRAWFISTDSRMNPNLQYAQAIRGLNTGRSFGIIDTLHLAEVAQAAFVLHRDSALGAEDWRRTCDWFREYLDWIKTSDPGKQERDAKNNHGTCWIVQAAAFGRMLGDRIVLDDCRDRLKNVVIPAQIGPDGSFPLELARTKPYGYCLFNLDVLGMAAQILSDSGSDLWRFRLSDGRNLESSFKFMAPFIADKRDWPYRHDIQYFDNLPVRQPSLLFAGLAYRNRDWLGMWQRLDPDPSVFEVIRNHPVRQPLLWI